jgi:integrase
MKHIKNSPENYSSMAGALRRFFRYCANHKFLRRDYSGLIPPSHRYRLAALPKGIEDSALNLMLRGIDRESPRGARDYAICILMMAYGIRGISAARLLLDDIDWRNSRIRIRAQKGGKEVMLPLVDAVGESVIEYLKYRQTGTPFREVFLSGKAPCQPLSSVAISGVIRKYMARAGVLKTGAGSRTLRHSWAIRALGDNSSIKAIADVLGHRYLDTTFIYAKADLKALKEVAMPWPEKA